jgi:hypothetical protein
MHFKVGIGRRRAKEPRRDGEGAERAARQGRGRRKGLDRERLGGRERVCVRTLGFPVYIPMRGMRASNEPTYQFRAGWGGLPCWGGGPSLSTVYESCQPGMVTNGPCRAWVGPKSRAFGRAAVLRAIWLSVAQYSRMLLGVGFASMCS